MVEKKKKPETKIKTYNILILPRINIHYPHQQCVYYLQKLCNSLKRKKIEIDFALQVYTVSPLFKNMYRFFCGHTIDYLQIDKESFRLSGDNFLSWLMRTEKIDPVTRKRNLL